MLPVADLIARGFGGKGCRWLRDVRRHFCAKGGIRPATGLSTNSRSC